MGVVNVHQDSNWIMCLNIFALYRCVATYIRCVWFSRRAVQQLLCLKDWTEQKRLDSRESCRAFHSQLCSLLCSYWYRFLFLFIFHTGMIVRSLFVADGTTKDFQKTNFSLPETWCWLQEVVRCDMHLIIGKWSHWRTSDSATQIFIIL